MIYSVTRIFLLLGILATVFMCSAMLMGWFGLNMALTTIQITLLTLGLYVFYASRPEKKDNSVWRWVKLPVHWLVLPLVTLAFWTIKAEQFAMDYWYIINFMLVLFLGVVLLNLVLKNQFKPLVKLFLGLLVVVYVTIVLLQMSGFLGNGQIVFFGTIAVVVAGILCVVLGLEKKVSNNLRG